MSELGRTKLLRRFACLSVLIAVQFVGAPLARAGQASPSPITSRPATNPVRSLIAVVYLETYRGGTDIYPLVARELADGLLTLPEADVDFVFWLDNVSKPPERLSLADVRASPARFDASLSHRRAGSAPDGAFEKGLAKSAEIAAANGVLRVSCSTSKRCMAH